jgi:hypothetical protein
VQHAHTWDLSRAREVDFKRFLLTHGYDSVQLWGQAVWPPSLRAVLPDWALERHAADMIAVRGKRVELWDAKSADDGDRVNVSMRTLLWSRLSTMPVAYGCSRARREAGMLRFSDHRRLWADALYERVMQGEDVGTCCDDDWRRFTYSGKPLVAARMLRLRCPVHDSLGRGGSGEPYVSVPLDLWTPLAQPQQLGEVGRIAA